MKSKLGLIVLVLVAIGAIWFANFWFKDPAYKKIPLSPQPHVIQREAEALRSAVKAMDDQAHEVAASAARSALADNYLSLQEEQETPKRVTDEVEQIKARAPYAAVLDGFTFPGHGGEAVKVAGFRFNSATAAEVLENEFRSRGTAVKERELIERLRGLLRNSTQDSRWLDDKEKDTVLRFILTPETGKKAGLNRAVALATIDRFCKENGIGQGPKPR